MYLLYFIAISYLILIILILISYLLSISPNSLLLGVLNSFLRCVRPLCHCWCPPISTDHVAFLFICLPGLSLLVSALFRWPCSISIRLSPRSVSAGVRPFPLAMQHFYSFVSQVCHCWCPPFSAGHAAFLFISQVRHCWCPPLSVGHQHFYSCVSQACHWWCPPFSAGHVYSISILLSPRSVSAGVRPFPLAMRHFYSLVSQVCQCWCAPFSGPCSISIYLFPGSVTGAAGLFRWPCSTSVFQVWCLHCCFLPCPLEQVHL